MIETPTVAPQESASALSVLESAFRAVEAKDVAAVLALGTDASVFIDPHYPTQRMTGSVAIADGLGWAFANIRSLKFTVVHAYEGLDGTSAAVEARCHQVMRGGLVRDFVQVFVIELQDGRIARLQAYEPFGPGGAVGIVLGVSRLARRLRRVGTWRRPRGRRVESRRT